MIAAGIPASIFVDLFMSRFLGQCTLFRRITVATLGLSCVSSPVCRALSQSTGRLTNGNFKASVSVLAQPVVTFRSTDFKVIGILKSAGAPICTVK